MAKVEPLDAIRASQFFRQSRRSSSLGHDKEIALPSPRPMAERWTENLELMTLRDADILYREYLKKRETEDDQGLARLLYPATRHLEHPEAATMINCCALYRVRTAEGWHHLRQALQAYRLALPLARGDLRWKLAINRISALNTAGVYSVAVREATELLVELPIGSRSVEVLCSNLGFAAGRSGNHELALHAYRHILDTHPENSPGAHDRFRLNVATAYIFMGNVEQATVALAHVTNMSSQFALAVLTRFLVRRHDWEVALSLGKMAIASFPPQQPWTRDRAVVADLHELVAQAYQGLGQPEAARRHDKVAKYLSMGLVERWRGGEEHDKRASGADGAVVESCCSDDGRDGSGLLLLNA